MTARYPSAAFLLEQYGLDQGCLQAIRNYANNIYDDVEMIVNEFYDWLLLSREFSDFFSDSQVLFHVKQQQAIYWREFLKADVNESYLKRRREVGQAHARIGLPVQPYFASMSFFLKKLTKPIIEKTHISEHDLFILQAITALAQLDAGIAVDAIFREHAESFGRMALGDFSNHNSPISEDDIFGIALSNMTSTLNSVEKICEDVADGHLDVSVEVKSTNDRLACSINRMISKLNDVATLANTISQGNYELEIEPSSEHDVLGKALNVMTKNLKTLTSEKEQELKKARALSSLSDALRGITKKSDFSNTVLNFCCFHFNALVGRMYLARENALHYLCGYADKPSDNNISYAFGEGLIGQAALNGRPLFLNDLPPDYIKVNSSLGEQNALSLLIWPIRNHEKIVFVIEIGSFRLIDENETDFLIQCAEKICATYDTVKASEKITELLNESIEKTRMLEDSNAALEEQTQALMKSEEILMEQQNELELSNHELINKTNDLEEQKRILLDTQSELEEKSLQLETTSQYKSEFLANMSHELRTPLNSLLLLAGMLAENTESNLTQEQVESASVIFKSGQELLELINDILDLSKIEAGQMLVLNEEVHLGDIVDEVVDSIQPQADVKNLILETSYLVTPDDKLISDSKKIHHVLRNLLSNAIKFTPEGKVSITVRNLSEKQDEKYIEQLGQDGIAICVADTGVGIPKEKQEIIFDAFRQADGTISRKFGGTGLGLSIVKQYTNLINGAIHLASEEHKGSEFTLYLPRVNTDSEIINISPPAISQHSTDSQINKPSHKLHNPVDRIKARLDELSLLKSEDNVLLIVEDDDRFASVLADLASDAGFKCICSNNGTEAFTLAEEIKPAAIILDVMLPDTDGWSIFDRIKNIPSLRHIPVQFISAHHDLYNARQKGAAGYLSKPVNKEDLSIVFDRLKQLSQHNISKALIISNNKLLVKSIHNTLKNKTIRVESCTLEGINDAVINQYACIVIDTDTQIEGVLDSIELISSTSLLNPPILLHGSKKLANSIKEKLLIFSHLAIKETHSLDILLDETTLFLHAKVDKLSTKQKETIRRIHDNNGFFKDKTILIVDDDMRNVFSLSKLLRANSMNTLIAEDGRIAIETLNAQNKIDLILMDIMMPVMDGYEAIRQIKNTKAYADIPIIALTAKSLPEDRHKSLLAGANDYLAKPIDSNRLLITMRFWLQQQLENA